jgi:hypothetical protein
MSTPGPLTADQASRLAALFTEYGKDLQNEGFADTMIASVILWDCERNGHVAPDWVGRVQTCPSAADEAAAHLRGEQAAPDPWHALKSSEAPGPLDGEPSATPRGPVLPLN